MRAGSGEAAPCRPRWASPRLLRSLCRDPQIGKRVVPIIPDEGRTFGMDSLFKEFEIYASQGQKYEPVDHDLLLSYTEDTDGQILEEGITEAGSMASFIAAGTSYATRGVPMIPFYTFYSMFGFQRIGDLIWQAADIRARGFLLGATAGRTTLLGEGLQHQDGHSLLLASTVPAVQAYDPAFAYEVGRDRPVRHRAHVRRPSRPTPSATSSTTSRSTTRTTRCRRSSPSGPTSSKQVPCAASTAGRAAPEGPSKRATILFSGIAHGAARAAVAELAEHYDVGRRAVVGDLVQEAPRGGAVRRALEPPAPVAGAARAARDAACSMQSQGPITAVTDFMKIVPEQIARFVPDGRPFTVLGTDGMGRSDTREALRRFFEIDMGHVVVGVLTGLLESGQVDSGAVDDAIKRYDIDPDASEPFHV